MGVVRRADYCRVRAGRGGEEGGDGGVVRGAEGGGELGAVGSRVGEGVEGCVGVREDGACVAGADETCAYDCYGEFWGG